MRRCCTGCSHRAGELTVDAPDKAAGRYADAFAGLPTKELRERLLDEVGSQIAGEMRMSPVDVDPRRSLVEQGLPAPRT
jgi:6-methylsalicylic acid synthase